MKKFFKEFKEFAVKGNALTLAIGVIIGSAFTAIVNSIVNDLFMPLIGIITGGYDITALSVTVGKGDHAATLTYGVFISAVINFIIVAFLLFLIVKGINAMHRKKEATAAPPAPVFICEYCRMEVAEEATKCPHCASEIKPIQK